MAGVGIAKHSETLTGLTAVRLNQLMDRQVNWKVMAQNGLTINNLNQLIEDEPSVDADLIITSIGGNDVFNLTPPWVWERDLKRCIKNLVRDGRKPLIIFSPVPCAGRFPAIPNPLRLVLGYWELLLQTSLTLVMNSIEDVHLLDDRFPDDGIHPSQLAYKLWSEKLASAAVEMM
jgi:lysophospholipase L1-like esterase